MNSGLKGRHIETMKQKTNQWQAKMQRGEETFTKSLNTSLSGTQVPGTVLAQY